MGYFPSPAKQSEPILDLGLFQPNLLPRRVGPTQSFTHSIQDSPFKAGAPTFKVAAGALHSTSMVVPPSQLAPLLALVPVIETPLLQPRTDALTPCPSQVGGGISASIDKWIKTGGFQFHS